MKKIALILSSFVLALSLSACNNDGTGKIDLKELTISGVEDITVEIGTELDLLEGLSIIGNDKVDYTNYVTVESDACYIDNSNSLDTSTAKACDVTYTVVVEGKLEQKSITVTIAKAAVVVDPNSPDVISWDYTDDSDLIGWEIYTEGSVVPTIDNGTLKMVTTSNGQRYETRYDYMGIPLVNGTNYVISFKAKSDIADKKVHVSMGEKLPADPYFNAFKEEGVDIVTLSTEWKDYTVSFTMNQDNSNGGILFEMGDMDGSTGLNATIWMDDLKISIGTGEDSTGPVVSGADNVSYFLEDTATFTSTEGVTATDNVDGDVTSSIVVSGDTVDTTTAGTYTVTYTVSDSLGNATVVNRVVTVENDTTGPAFSGTEAKSVVANSTFDALTGVTALDNRDGDVTSSIVVSGDTVDTTTVGTYDVIYTVKDALDNTTTLTRVITVTESGTATTDWEGYDMTVTEANGNISITYADISTDLWFNKNAQLPYSTFDGTTESVVITFTGVASQEYFFKLEGANDLAVQSGITASGEEQSITLDLKTLDESAITTINKLVVFAQTGGASGTIVISNIEYTIPAVVVDGVWIGYGMDVTVTDSVATATYTAVSSPWWDTSVQYKVTDFDETKNSLQFTFTGTLDQEYVFKVEGGNKAVEGSVVATGSEQIITIPLNQLTTEQRDALELLVVFSKAEGSAGSITLTSWSHVDVDMPSWNVYGGVTLTENANSDTLTYTNTPENWWENNAIQVIDTFDGTKTGMTFTFTGEAGHLYLFKIESPTTHVQAEVTATGSSQVFTLSLDTLTETERNDLNLIIWFSQTVASSGTITIDGWDYTTN